MGGPGPNTTNYTGTFTTTGNNLGLITYTITVSDGAASPTSISTSSTVDVVANRVVTAATANSGSFGLVHVNGLVTLSSTFTSPGADNQNTRVTVANGGVDSGGNGVTVAGGNPATVFNGSTSDTRLLSGSFSTLGAKSGTVTLTTGSEGLVGESPINVGIEDTAQVYSGKASWAITGTTGSWATVTNWGDTAAADLNGFGAPGTAGAASAGDTATFNDVLGQSGTTTVTLDGANVSLAGITFNSVNTSYTIATGVVTSGTGSITLQNAATPITVNSGTATISTTLTGSGGLLASGTGTLILNATNTYTGSTTIANGVVIAVPASSIPSKTILTLGSGSNSGELVLGTLATNFPNVTVAGLYVSGSGSANAVVGATGTNNSTLTVNTGTGVSDAYSGALGGVGTNQNNLNLVKTGAGTLILTGSLSYPGSTTINGGVLQVALSSLPTNTYIDLGGNNAQPYAILQVAGGGSFTPTGLSAASLPGYLNWANGSGFAAINGKLTVTIGGGQLVWGTAGFLGTGGSIMAFGSSTANSQVELTNAINLNTLDNFQRFIDVEPGTGGDSALLSGVISPGAVGVNISGIDKIGAGLLILTGANTYSGVTTINAGTLEADSQIGSATGSGTVQITPNLAGSIATLSGNGIITGTVISSGSFTSGTSTNTAHIAPGDNVSGLHGNFGNAGTLTVGALQLGNGTRFDYDLGTPTGSDLINVTNPNTLVLGNNIVLNINQLTTIANNTPYNIIDYSGTLTGAGDLATWTTGGNPPVGTAVFGYTGTSVTVIFLTTPTAAYWTGNQGGGGLSTWNTTSASDNSNWATDATGATDIYQAPGATTNVFFSMTGVGPIPISRLPVILLSTA